MAETDQLQQSVTESGDRAYSLCSDEGFLNAAPCLREQLDLLLRITCELNRPIKQFLDLGCRSGDLGISMLERFPNAGGVFVDPSEEALQSAWERTGQKNKKLAFIGQHLSDPEWAESVRFIAPFDLVISAFQFHQLPDQTKIDVYADVHDLLGPGGLFLNLDFVSNGTPYARSVFDRLYVESLAQSLAPKSPAGSGSTPPPSSGNAGPSKPAPQGPNPSPKSVPDLDAAKKAFESKFVRADMNLAPAEEQCAWLTEIGYVGVECHFRYLGIALFGGAKAGNPPDAEGEQATPGRPGPIGIPRPPEAGSTG